MKYSPPAIGLNFAPKEWGFNGCPVQGETFDGRNFTLTDHLYYTAKDGRQFRTGVRATTDGLSGPRAGWVILPPFGIYWPGAVFHDSGYRDTIEIFNGTEWIKVSLTKDETDNLFLECLEWLKIQNGEVKIIFDAVRDCGQESFDEDRKKLS